MEGIHSLALRNIVSILTSMHILLQLTFMLEKYSKIIAAINVTADPQACLPCYIIKKNYLLVLI